MNLDLKIKEYIETITAGCYKNYVLQLDKLCDDLKIDCYDVEFKDPKVDGLIFFEKDKYVIYINEKHPFTRRRFTLAHELGHYISAQCDSYSKAQLIAEGFKDSGLSLRKEGNFSPAETEANEIAAEILMPKPSVQKLCELGIPLEAMAREFSVSEIAMSIRLRVLYPDLVFA